MAPPSFLLGSFGGTSRQRLIPKAGHRDLAVAERQGLRYETGAVRRAEKDSVLPFSRETFQTSCHSLGRQASAAKGFVHPAPMCGKPIDH